LLYSAEHNVLVYKVADPMRIAAATEGAKLLNGQHVGVPATLGNIQLLCGLGFPVIGPMELAGYDWPIKAPLRPLAHQKITANFLVAHKKCFCLNDMGTMKTLSALWAADYLMEMERRNGRVCRGLVVAPLSTLESVWSEAIFRHFLGRRKCVVVHGSADQRQKLLERNVDFYVINFEGLGIGLPTERKSPLKGLIKDLHSRTDIRLGIFDEASAYRHANTRRHRAARVVVGGLEYLWLMTGTPTSNGPEDAYGLAKLVNNAFGESFTNYKHRVMMQLTQFKWVPRHGAAEAASKMLTPSIRYSIEECVDLPPCTKQVRTCELSKEQSKALRTLKQDAVLALEGGALVHAVNEAALRLKLIQTVAGAIYDGTHQSHDLNPAPRIELVKEIVEECSQKVIIAAPLTNVLHLLYKALQETEDHAGFTCAIVNGETPLVERRTLFKQFGDANHRLRVLIVDPASVAHGINDLVSASVVVWYCPTDKGELYDQLNKRIDRPGQRHPTTVVQICATKIEREIFDRLDNNQAMQGLILKFARDQ
jgi:SNF2 family DNA or RNA helicase